MIEEEKSDDLVFFDFSKEIHMVCLGVLIKNLYDIGIRGNTLA